jgi:anti-sigma factor RsiW
MVTCKRIQRKLSAFLDREVSSEEAARIEQHVAICPACRREAGALAATYQLLELCPPALRTGLRPVCPVPAPTRSVGFGRPAGKGLSISRRALGTGHWAPILAGLLVGTFLGVWLWPRLSAPVAPSSVIVDLRSSRPRDPEAFEAPARDPLEEVYVTLTSTRGR